MTDVGGGAWRVERGPRPESSIRPPPYPLSLLREGQIFLNILQVSSTKTEKTEPPGSHPGCWVEWKRMAGFTDIVTRALIASALLCAAANASEMSRQEREAYLRSAKIVSMKDVGEGATHPIKVKMDDGITKMKAIFKSVDLRTKWASRFGSETAKGYIDSYKNEIAAYELDKLLGLGMLPVTVERKIKGKRGSLREWVEHVIPHYGHEEAPPDVARMHDQMHVVWLFDYLIYNVDRRTHNLMLGPGWAPVLIDHSMGFMGHRKPFRPMYRFPREVIDRLRALDERTVRKALRRYLKRHQIKSLMRRRETVLDSVDRQLAGRDTSEVFFSLAAVTQ